MVRVALHNLGCKVNSYETQAMQEMLMAAGYTIVPFAEELADVYIINTCSVTNIADRKSRQMIHKARKMNPKAVVVAAGCYVESATKKDMVDEDIDLVIGNHEKSRLIELLDTYFAPKVQEVRKAPVDMLTVREYDEMKIEEPENHTRAYVKIQDGCNRFCSYCIIPYVRGRIRSRKPEDVVEEIQRIASHGCKEVVLTGIHLSSYGLDCPSEGMTLMDIIKRVHEIDGIERIRLGSLEPRIITEEFVSQLVQLKKVCPHFHLSLQSGCDSVLERMNRKYTTEEFKRGVELLRHAYEHVAITTDVIVGFPGETEEEFERTKAYLLEISFYELHVFKYSRRKGTVADRMPGQLTDRIKSLRSEALLLVDESCSQTYRAWYKNRRVKVLLEELKEIDGDSYAVGYTDTYVRVAIPMKPEQFMGNALVEVFVTELFGKDMVLGTLTENVAQ